MPLLCCGFLSWCALSAIEDTWVEQSCLRETLFSSVCLDDDISPLLTWKEANICSKSQIAWGKTVHSVQLSLYNVLHLAPAEKKTHPSLRPRVPQLLSPKASKANGSRCLNSTCSSSFAISCIRFGSRPCNWNLWNARYDCRFIDISPSAYSKCSRKPRN